MQIWKRCLMFGSILSSAVAFPVSFKAASAPQRVCAKSPSPLFGWPTFHFLQSIMSRTYWSCHQRCFFFFLFPVVYFLPFKFFPSVSWEIISRWETAWIMIRVFYFFLSTSVLFSHLNYITKSKWTPQSTYLHWSWSGPIFELWKWTNELIYWPRLELHWADPSPDLDSAPLGWTGTWARPYHTVSRPCGWMRTNPYSHIS